MKKRALTTPMNEWGLSVRIFSWGLESSPQVLNLNKGLAICRTRG